MAAKNCRVKERDSHDLPSLLLPSQKPSKGVTDKRHIKGYGLVTPSHGEFRIKPWNPQPGEGPARRGFMLRRATPPSLMRAKRETPAFLTESEAGGLAN